MYASNTFSLPHSHLRVFLELNFPIFSALPPPALQTPFLFSLYSHPRISYYSGNSCYLSSRFSPNPHGSIKSRFFSPVRVNCTRLDPGKVLLFLHLFFICSEREANIVGRCSPVPSLLE